MKNGFKPACVHWRFCYNVRISPFKATFPHQPAALAAQIYKDVMKGDENVREAAKILGQKGIQQILMDNKYGLGPGRESLVTSWVVTSTMLVSSIVFGILSEPPSL